MKPRTIRNLGIASVILIAALLPACGPDEAPSFQPGNETGAGGQDNTTGTGGTADTTTSSSTTSDTPTDTGTTCSQKDLEPNDAVPIDFGAITDCDDDAVEAKGTFGDGSDHDWYELDEADTPGCATNPTFSLDAPVEAEICAFFSCDDGDTAITCPSGSTEEIMKSKGLEYPGCCVVGAKRAPLVNCNGTTDDSAHTWVRVTSSVASCIDYTLGLHY